MSPHVKRWIRTAAIAFGAVLLLLAAAAAYLVATFDANRYKGTLIEWTREHKQRTLAIDGPVSLSVFPRLEVTLRQVSLSEHRRADEFLRLDQAALAVEVLPLLRKQLVVDRVQASGLRLRYTRDAQGRRNIDDLLQSDKQPDNSGNDGSGRSLQFDVNGIELRNVRVSMHDVPAKLQGEVHLRSLTTGRLADGVESPVALDAGFDLVQPSVRGDLKGDTRLRLALDSGSLALTDMKLAYAGSALGMEALDTRASGNLAYDGSQGALRAEGLRLESSAMLGALKLEPSTVSLQRFSYEPQRRALAVEQLAVELKAVRDKQPIEARLQWPQLQVEGSSLKGSALQGRVALGGAQGWSADFRSAAPSGSFDEVRLPGFEATLAGSGERKLSGSLRTDLLLQIAKTAVALDKLELQAQLQDPSLKPLQIAVKGRAQASAQAAQWQLAGALNNNAFDTQGTAAFAGTVPTVHAKGQFAKLDLNTLLAEPSAATAGKPAATGGADSPIDLSPLRSLQGSLSLKAGSLIYRPYQLDDARIEATLDGGMLRVGTLAGRIWSGSIDADAFADARAQRVMFKGAATNIDINAALQDVAQKDVLEGRGRVSFDLESAGKTVGEMKSRLDGQAALQLRDGAIKGINLARTLREAKAALTLQKDAVQQARQTEKTDFSELSASFQIADGVARNRDLDVKSPFLRLGGEGAIDIGRSRIDYTARAVVAGTSKGQGGAELAALRGLTVPVRLTGPLDAIDWRVQWSAVAVGAAENTLKNKLADKLKKELGVPSAEPAAPAASAPAKPTKPRDALKDKLKDLLK
ncbi:AsmA family protein [Schlegelella sp. S2-27]|uniref:AsmA family protein n=1 Tax=Caldimonas mangrovi TaxID=2944811 RepID=A0ABT0YQ11_9BURK|nr:AsmA family protein [Caldimonas mangrovi]MCM5680827.1 AsmA family protein [Caldimonas mangrovi]